MRQMFKSEQILSGTGRLTTTATTTVDEFGIPLVPNGMSSIYPVAVRLGWDPLCILREMKSMIGSIGLANGFIRDNPHGIENCSIVPTTINEMLCTAHQRVLRVFKVWPRETDASFRDLRVPGVRGVARWRGCSPRHP